jgi:hypothetical protein
LSLFFQIIQSAGVVAALEVIFSQVSEGGPVLDDMVDGFGVAARP